MTNTNDLTYRELLQHRELLDAKIAEMRTEAIASGIAQIREIMSDLDISLADIGGKGMSMGKSRQNVQAKFRNPQTGQTWSGRGRAPSWMNTGTREEFRVTSENMP